MQLTIARSVRTGQLITFALIQGVILIAAIFTFLVLSRGDANVGENDPVANEPVGGGAFVLPAILVGITSIGFAASMILPPTLRRTGMNRFRAENSGPAVVPGADETLDDSMSKLLGADMTARIVGQALCEGPGIIGAVFMLIDDNPAYLIVPTIAIVGIASHTPTVTKVRHWMEEGLRTSVAPPR